MKTTKQSMEESLKKALLQKPLHKVTISDITDDCEISRMTFYYHFKDIYELVEWSCVEDGKQLLAGKKSEDTWQQGFYSVFQYIQENQQFIRNVYRSIGQERVEEYLGPIVRQLVLDVIDELAEGLDVAEADRRFIADCYRYAFIGVVLDWFRSDMKEDPSEIVERSYRLIHGSIDRALKEFARN